MTLHCLPKERDVGFYARCERGRVRVLERVISSDVLESEVKQIEDALRTTLGGEWDTFAAEPSATVRAPLKKTRYQEALDILVATEHRASEPGTANLEELEMLGAGGMGVVHLAHQGRLGRDVAVKRVRKGEKYDVRADSLIREGWVMAALDHPNIPPVYDVNIDAENRPYVVVKRIEGKEWSQLILDETHLDDSSDEALLLWNLGVLEKVCHAVGYAHSKNIIHRDLKPSNVMIGKYGMVYVLDWGLAIALDEDADKRLPNRTNCSQPAGTPSFMAPEQVSNDPALLGVQTDTYLIGGLLYVILMGKPPHRGKARENLLKEILMSEVAFDDGVAPELAAICRRCLEPEESLRFTEVQEIQSAIRLYLKQRASNALVSEATKRITQLEELAGGDGDGREMSRLFSETRFALNQALKGNPSNSEAAKTLASATEFMAMQALEDGLLDAANAYAAELDSISPELEQALAEARLERAREEERLAKLLRKERDHDVRIGQRDRAIFLIALAISWLVLSLAAGMLQRRGLLEIDLPFLFFSGLFFLLAATAITILLQSKIRVLLSGRVHMAGIFCSMFGSVAMLGFAALVGVKVTTAIALAHIIMATGALHGRVHDPRISVSAMILPLGLVIPWLPEYAIETSGLVVALALLAVAYTIRGREGNALAKDAT